MAGISAIKGREILDSRGNPTVEVTVTLEDGTQASAGVPSGASTGALEAIELRDSDSNRYNGLGVLNAIKNVNTELREGIMGLEASAQREIDETLCKLDGTFNKARLGANAILGVSLAVCRASALSQGIPLYRHIANLASVSYDSSAEREKFPMPMFNIINGGKHSDAGISAQEFKIIPFGIPSYPEQLRAGSEIFHALATLLQKESFSTGVGDEGGFAPRLQSHDAALEIISLAVKEAGYNLGKDIFIDLDVAADSFFDTTLKKYNLKPEGVMLSRESLVNVYRDWIQKYSVVSIEDGLEESDWDGWAMMKEKLLKEKAAWNNPVMIIGDDLLVTNVERVKIAIEKDACNAVLIKPNQIGSVTETMDCMLLAKNHSMNRVVSHRSGETTDDFIADLAVGMQAEFIKTGSLSRGERIVKYNRLLAIYEEFTRAK